MEYRKNDYVTVTIEDMGSEGEGIGKVDGFTLFVKDAVIGDKAEVKLVKVKKNYAYARLEKLLVPSVYRMEPVCSTYRQCGGCQLQMLSYEHQLTFKQRKISNDLIRIGGFASELIENIMEPIIGMEEPYHYRNKAQYPIGTDREGNPVAGFYAGRTHSIISNTDCSLGTEENKAILKIILEHMKKYKIPAYDETTGQGLVRHVLIRKGFSSGELMVCLVVNHKGSEESRTLDQSKRSKATFASEENFLPGQQELVSQLIALPGMASISVNINIDRTNVILGNEVCLLWGSPVISDTIHVRDMRQEGYPFTGRELTFHISPLSFYQVNPVQTEKLYSLVLDFAGLTGRETVWDLYCGIGTISLFLAGQAGRVCGVEVVPQAIEDARENAERNGIANAEFFVGKAEEVLPEFYERMSEGEALQVSGKVATGREALMPEQSTCAMQGVEQEKDRRLLHPDVIVVDPPRKGCDMACLETMLKMQPEKIVYVSCNPATLARDLKILCEGGYELKRTRGVDMFPHTVHVETVVLLSQ